MESELCASFKAAMDAGEPVSIEADQSLTLADGMYTADGGEGGLWYNRTISLCFAIVCFRTAITFIRQYWAL